MENKTGVIIQARLTSTRFPGKIIQKLGDQTVIDYLIAIRFLLNAEAVVVTSNNH